MAIDIAKLCADFLKTTVNSKLNDEKLSSSHAHELVSAFFGYQSKISLLAEKEFVLDRLEEARLYFPDIPLMDRRREKIKGLPKALPSSERIAKLLANFIGKTLKSPPEFKIYSSFKDYIIEVLLPDNEHILNDDLSGVMAGTNAIFADATYFESLEFIDKGQELIALISGTITGDQDEDKPYSGHELEVAAKVTFQRVAGVYGFESYEIEASGWIVDDPGDYDGPHRPSLIGSDIEEIGFGQNRVDPDTRNSPRIFEAMQNFQDRMKPFVEAARQLQVTTNLLVQSPGFQSFVDQYQVIGKQFASLSINLGMSLRPYLESPGFHTALQNMARFSESMKISPGLSLPPMTPMVFPRVLPKIEGKETSEKDAAPFVIEQVKCLGTKKTIGFDR